MTLTQDGTGVAASGQTEHQRRRILKQRFNTLREMVPALANPEKGAKSMRSEAVILQKSTLIISVSICIYYIMADVIEICDVITDAMYSCGIYESVDDGAGAVESGHQKFQSSARAAVRVSEPISYNNILIYVVMR